MFTNLRLNVEAGSGPMTEALSNCRFDSGLLRPYYDDNGIPCCTVDTGRTKLNKKGERERVYENIPVQELI